MVHQAPLKLPPLNLSNEYLKPDEVRGALEEYGCFLAVFDSVSPELNNEIFHALEELFDLPRETKICNTSEKPFETQEGGRGLNSGFTSEDFGNESIFLRIEFDLPRSKVTQGNLSSIRDLSDFLIDLRIFFTGLLSYVSMI
ncbi:deoxypodophyllotoxin synthase-like [Lycium barbarum]|uniref:deoxypodophyllotoxin synthase-like n=1 Tax=Lycium barbarum TaxID=112863 RepID=UPI00293E56BC|nr:deoxypodophyllotoxin synthase-like [Lycium barbarum]